MPAGSIPAGYYQFLRIISSGCCTHHWRKIRQNHFHKKVFLLSLDQLDRLVLENAEQWEYGLFHLPLANCFFKV